MRRDDKAAVGLGHKSGKVLLDVVRITNGMGSQLYCKRSGGGFCRVEETDIGRCIRVEDKSDSFGVGCNLL